MKHKIILTALLVIVLGFSGCNTISSKTDAATTAELSQDCFLDGSEFFHKDSPWAIDHVKRRGQVFALAHVFNDDPTLTVEEAVVIFRLADLRVVRYAYYCGGSLQTYILDLATDKYIKEKISPESRRYIDKYLTNPYEGA